MHETRTVEFKETITNTFLKTVSAFSNYEGGAIFFGIDDNGNIKAYGLDADTYILTETKTLPGYNLLNDTITVVIDENGNEMNSRAESPAGNYVLMSMVKNKSCPPTRRTGFYTLNYEFGIDYLKDLVEVAMKYGIIDKSGAWFSIIDTETGELKAKLQGMSNVYKHLEDPENESTLTMIENYVDKQMSMK